MKIFYKVLYFLFTFYLSSFISSKIRLDDLLFDRVEWWHAPTAFIFILVSILVNIGMFVNIFLNNNKKDNL